MKKDFREEELLRIYSKAVLPDSLESTNRMDCLPAVLDSFGDVSCGEHDNFCCGLETRLMYQQDEINRLREDSISAEKKETELLREIRALNKKIEQRERDLHEIQVSRAWFLVQLFRCLYGFLKWDPKTISESRSSIDHMLLKSPDSKAITLMSYLLHGAEKMSRQLPVPVSAPSGTRLLAAGKEVPYLSFYQENESFHSLPDDLKTVVFYLPQYHTFPENDAWWGKGFTEWVNTRKAKPRFPGHYQPRTPHRDIGYYDLSDIETMRKQAALAKQHGIDYFCFYYYWFDGKKLMEKPLEQLIAHPEIDMKFCLCWANENWTRAWDGQQKSVLIQQNYSDENDVNFIRDLKKYITDPRYMRCDGKPVILIYHAKIMPDPGRTFAVWRKWCRKNGVGEILIWSCRTFITKNEFEKPAEVDREVEFPPHMVSDLELFPSSKFEAYRDDGYYYNYRKVIQDLRDGKTMADISPYPFYRCAMLGWDNSCRRASGYSVWQYFSLENYHYWLRRNIEYTRKNFSAKERFLFINAWNEWAEGTYLEPDERCGYASINTTSRALCNLPAIPEYNMLQPFGESVAQPGKILIHLHVFYPDLMEEFSDYLNHMPFEYDSIITTDERRKVSAIRRALKKKPLTQCRKLKIVVTANCGRDVAPFFAVCRKRIPQYDYIGHFHTKKSPTVNWGDEWRHYLLDQLLGKKEYIQAVFRRFERDPQLGVFFPAPYPAMRDYMSWEQNRDRCEELLRAMNISLELPEHPLFPVGQMFWAKSQAIAPLFAPGIVEQSAFEKEAQQVSDTLAHAIERLWKYVAQGAGFTTLAGVFPPIYHPAAAGDKKPRRLALYVHYSGKGNVAAADIHLLQELKKSSDIIFISNSSLDKAARNKVSSLVKKIISRKNQGFDFGAWRDALNACSLTDYDELILLNNSILGPFCSFEEIFGKMAETDADFWGMTEFPEICNPRREEAKSLPGSLIPRHIQSYFLVFKRKVFLSDAFRNFWKNVKDETTLPDVVAHCETQLSRILENAGFKSDVYLRTAARLQEVDKITPEYNAIYCRPQDFLILGFPFLKKNICYYMDQSEINETVHMISGFTSYPVKNINITAKTR